MRYVQFHAVAQPSTIYRLLMDMQERGIPISVTGVAGAWRKFVHAGEYECSPFTVNTWSRCLKRLGVVKRAMQGRSRSVRLQRERFCQILQFVPRGLGLLLPLPMR